MKKIHRYSKKTSLLSFGLSTDFNGTYTYDENEKTITTTEIRKYMDAASKVFKKYSNYILDLDTNLYLIHSKRSFYFLLFEPDKTFMEKEYPYSHFVPEQVLTRTNR